MNVSTPITIQNNTDQGHLKRPLYETQNSRKKTKVILEKFLEMVSPYNRIELPAIFLNKNIVLKRSELIEKKYKVHFYPSGKIKAALKELENTSEEERIKSFEEKFKSNELSVEKDITAYFNERFLDENTCSIEKTGLYQRGKKLQGDYIFVLDLKNRLILGKKRPTKYGRVHHSSLARGLPVKAAGAITITVNEVAQNIFMMNSSGHYKPTPESLDHLVELFNKEGYKLKNEKLFVKGKFRVIEYTF